MRFLGVDAGRRRVGLALSDDSGVLARPWRTIGAGASPAATADDLIRLIRAEAEGDLGTEIRAIVVGLPKRLNGTDTDHTPGARALAAALASGSGLEVHLQDERLSSVEAEARLAAREKDWRKRKALIDATAAAIILQDFLDQLPRSPIEEPRIDHD